MKIKKLIVNCWDETCVYNKEQKMCAGECSLKAIFISTKGNCMSARKAKIGAGKQ